MPQTELILCPHDGHDAFEIYFEDHVRRWRCTWCHRLLSETEYELKGGELLRRPPKARTRRQKWS